MKCLSKDEANNLLRGIGMKLGDWNEVVDLNRHQDQNHHFINYRAPRDAIHLYCFSQHVAGWLPAGSWKMFQIDNSTYLKPDEAFLFGRILLGADSPPDFSKDRSFVFEFAGSQDFNVKVELLIANLIFVFLLFECHGYIVSSASHDGEIIGVQDGFIYFLTRDSRLSGARELISKFEENPSRYPDWVCQLEQ